jgi:hypothetical protein
MKKIFPLFFILFLISRLFFLANYPYFFDSVEYLKLSKESNFFASLAQSHESIHPLYLYLIQLSQKIFFSFFKVFGIYPVSFVSAVFAILGTVCFLILIKRLFNREKAFFSLLPLIFFSHLWLVQTNILHESIEQGFFLSGLLFFDIFLEKRTLLFFCLSFLSWSLAIFNFSGIILWFFLALAVVCFRSTKKNFKRNLIFLSASFLLAFGLSLLSLYFIFLQFDPEPLKRLEVLFFNYGGKGIFSGWSLLELLRTLRNSFLILFYGYSPFSVLVIIFLAILLLKAKNYKGLLLMCLSLIPFFVSARFWYGGLFGRYSSLVAYPLALFFALIANKKLYFLAICGLVVFFIPTFLVYQQKPIAEVEASLLEEIEFKENDLLVLSDYQRPQLEDRFKKALFLTGDSINQTEIKAEIREKLDEKKRVFISFQAVKFPYLQYDGQQIHIISKGEAGKPVLKDFLLNKKLIPASIDPKYPYLSLYQLKDNH